MLGDRHVEERRSVLGMMEKGSRKGQVKAKRERGRPREKRTQKGKKTGASRSNKPGTGKRGKRNTNF